jgi:hypothetical protein
MSFNYKNVALHRISYLCELHPAEKTDFWHAQQLLNSF